MVYGLGGTQGADTFAMTWMGVGFLETANHPSVVTLDTLVFYAKKDGLMKGSRMNFRVDGYTVVGLGGRIQSISCMLVISIRPWKAK